MTITAANAVLTIAVASYSPTPQAIKGFSADDVTDGEAQAVAEVMMGVDGILTAGYVNIPFVQTLTLMGDSDSNAFFDGWQAAEDQIQDKLVATGLILYPSLGRKCPLTRGFLTNYKPVPAARRVLQPRPFTITWQRGRLQPI